MEIVGALILAGHVVGLTLVILWIGLDMPVTLPDLRRRLRLLFLGHPPKPRHLP